MFHIKTMVGFYKIKENFSLIIGLRLNIF